MPLLGVTGRAIEEVVVWKVDEERKTEMAEGKEKGSSLRHSFTPINQQRSGAVS